MSQPQISCSRCTFLQVFHGQNICDMCHNFLESKTKTKTKSKSKTKSKTPRRHDNVLILDFDGTMHYAYFLSLMVVYGLNSMYRRFLDEINSRVGKFLDSYKSYKILIITNSYEESVRRKLDDGVFTGRTRDMLWNLFNSGRFLCGADGVSRDKVSRNVDALQRCNITSESTVISVGDMPLDIRATFNALAGMGHPCRLISVLLDADLSNGGAEVCANLKKLEHITVMPLPSVQRGKLSNAVIRIKNGCVHNHPELRNEFYGS